MEEARANKISKPYKLTVVVVLGALASRSVSAEPLRDVSVIYNVAEREGRVGYARKVKLVDARAAALGEVVSTLIKNEGLETRSPPAGEGDMVVRNRCSETGNEEILVSKGEFLNRYDGPIGPEGTDGWRPYQPRGHKMLFFRVRPDDGTFMFKAPWGNEMVARPGDVIVRDPSEPKNTYRIAAAAFACTYEITQPERWIKK